MHLLNRKGRWIYRRRWPTDVALIMGSNFYQQALGTGDFARAERVVAERNLELDYLKKVDVVQCTGRRYYKPEKLRCEKIIVQGIEQKEVPRETLQALARQVFANTINDWDQALEIDFIPARDSIDYAQIKARVTKLLRVSGAKFDTAYARLDANRPRFAGLLRFLLPTVRTLEKVKAVTPADDDMIHAAAYLSEVDSPTNPKSPTAHRFATYIARARLEGIDFLEKRLNADFSYSPKDIMFTDLPMATEPAIISPEAEKPQTPAHRNGKRSRINPNLRLEMVLSLWQKARNPRPKTMFAARKAVADFKTFVSDVPITEIVAADLFDFRDALAGLPSSMTADVRKLDFLEQIKICKENDDELDNDSRSIATQRVSPATVKKYVGVIQTLLGFAFQEQLIETNMGAGISINGYSKLNGGRRPFTQAELTQLFSSKLFAHPWSEKLSDSKVSDETVRWLFLIAAQSGARIEEIGQALIADIKQDSGIWYLDVTDYISDGDRKQGNIYKNVKTESSRRLIPLHQNLVEIGFLKFVENLKRSGEIKLFRDLEADALGINTKEASRRCGRIIDEYISDDSRLVFHSFRHSFKDLCRKAGILTEVHDQITGHAPTNVGGGYGNGLDVLELSRELHRIDLSFIDWNTIKAAAAM